MRILFLTENFPPEVNAAATRVYERALYWARAGHEVTILTCFPNFPQGRIYANYRQRPWQIEVVDGLRIVRVMTYVARNEGFIRRTLDFVSFMVSAVLVGTFLRRPDVVVATSPQFFAAVAGWLLAAVKRRPFVFELGDIWPASIRAVGAMRASRLLDMLERFELFLYRRSAAVVALTPAFKRNLVARGICPGKIAVVINGVDLTRYAPKPRSVELDRNLQTTGRFVVGYFGTHGLAHQLENALAAAALLRDEPRVLWLFVGDGAAKPGLVRRAAELDLKSILFLDPQEKSRMPDLWSVCDLALVHLKGDPVFAEVIPSKMFEAMGAGRPLLLVAPKGEASRIIEQTNAGVWVNSADPAALAETVRGLCRDAPRLDRFREYATAAAPHFSRQRQAEDMIRVLEAVSAGEGDSVARVLEGQ